MLCYIVLYCPMLCYIVLCCVMLRYVVVCFVMLCYVFLCITMLCYVALCCGMLYYVMPCCAMLWFVVLCFSMYYYVVLCCAMLWNVVLCYAMLRYVVVCCAMLFCVLLCCATAFLLCEVVLYCPIFYFSLYVVPCYANFSYFVHNSAMSWSVVFFGFVVLSCLYCRQLNLAVPLMFCLCLFRTFKYLSVIKVHPEEGLSVDRDWTWSTVNELHSGLTCLWHRGPLANGLKNKM